MSKEPTTEAVKVADHLLPDGASAYNPDGFLFQLESFQALELEVVVPDPLAGAGNMPYKGEHQAQGEFRDGVRGVGGDGCNRDAEFPGCRNIDVVVAGAEGGH